MQMKTKGLVMAMAAAPLIALAAGAESPQRAEVIALVQKAAAHIKNVGAKAACRDFADPSKGFQKGQLYLFVEDMNATMICNVANSRLDGKSMKELKDSNGKAFNKELIETAQKNGSGWVDYIWVNPVTKQLAPKSSYVEAAGDYMVGMGIFKQQ